MGLNHIFAEYLIFCHQEGVNFTKTLTLGRQSVHLNEWEAEHLWESFGVDLRSSAYAENIFSFLGAEQLDSMDASSYEEATIIHNLNVPVSRELKNRFDCVIDGGTLEHIFFFPQAFKSAMEMTRVGGHLILCSPANNLMGHGFYQFSPELFWSALTESNGFEISNMFLNCDGLWFEVADPNEVKARVEALTTRETFLFVAARRTRESELFQNPPHQSDYKAEVIVHSVSKIERSRGINRTLLKRYRVARWLQKHWRRWRGRRSRSLQNDGLFRCRGRVLAKRKS